MTDLDHLSPEAIEHDLAQLDAHGIGCPRAVQLGGPGVIRDWIEGHFSRIEIGRQNDANEQWLAESDPPSEAPPAPPEDAEPGNGPVYEPGPGPFAELTERVDGLVDVVNGLVEIVAGLQKKK